MKSPELRYNRKDNNHSILAYDTLGVYRILGTYETKERAIEILNEIQDLLQNAYVGGSNRVVYQMPKDK